jgi:hypothetical protein
MRFLKLSLAAALSLAAHAEEKQGSAGLEELLTRTRKIIDKKYAPFKAPEEKEREKAKVAEPEPEKPERLRLEK